MAATPPSLACDVAQLAGRLEGFLFAIAQGAPLPPLLDALEGEVKQLADLAPAIAALERAGVADDVRLPSPREAAS